MSWLGGRSEPSATKTSVLPLNLGTAQARDADVRVVLERAAAAVVLIVLSSFSDSAHTCPDNSLKHQKEGELSKSRVAAVVKKEYALGLAS